MVDHLLFGDYGSIDRLSQEIGDGVHHVLVTVKGERMLVVAGEAVVQVPWVCEREVVDRSGENFGEEAGQVSVQQLIHSSRHLGIHLIHKSFLCGMDSMGRGSAKV